MNYNYNNNQNENISKKKVTGIFITALVILLVMNLIVLAVLSSNLRKVISEETNSALNSVNSSLDERIDDAIANRITTTIAGQVAENITDNVVQSATTTMQSIITEEIIDNYKREYNLPENYAGIGVIAAKEVGSVLELEGSATLNAPKNNQTTSSQSSAFIINAQGYAITNAHCVTFEDNIWQHVGGFWGYQSIGTETRVYTTLKAKFKGNVQQYDMEVIAYDINKDLAIIKFVNPPANLKPITFANSSLVNLGEEVAAIGNAQGLGTSLTTGVVSNTPQPYNNVTIVQTDTTINPGNSGGPLFNIYGEVVGVVTFKIIQSQANEGLGFAIASNSVIEYIETVKQNKGIEISFRKS